MSSLANAPRMTRLALRQEIRWIPISVVVFALTYLATLKQLSDLAGTVADRRGMQQSLTGNPALQLLLGPLDHIETVASTVSWRIGLFMLTAFGVIIVFTVNRHTRREEESGQLELAGSAAVGRLSPLLAAVAVETVLTVLTALVTSLPFLGYGATGRQVVLQMGQYAGVGVAVTGVTLLVAQIATTARQVSSITSALVLGGYLLRGAADTNSTVSWLKWTNPIGWAQTMDPYGTGSWWGLLWCVLLGAAGLGSAVVLRDRRDLGSGLITPRPGPSGSSGLRSVPAVLWQAQWRTFTGWVIGILAFALIVGSLVSSVADTSGVPAQFQEYLRKLGGPGALTGAFLSAMAVFFSAAIAFWLVSLVADLRRWETRGQLELALSTARSRRSWLVTTALMGVLGSVLLLLVAAAGVALLARSQITVADVFRALLVQAPAAWLLFAIAVLLFAVRPAWTAAGWVVAALAVLVGELGAAFGLPGWALDLSPFTHTPRVPQMAITWTPLVLMTALAGVLFAVAMVAFDRRDIPS